MTAAPRIAVLGAGRAGCSLHHILSAENTAPTLLWTRSAATAASARADNFPAETGPLPRLGDFDLVLLAVSDGAVAPLAAELAASPLSSTTMFAHLAGSLDLTPLEPLRARGHSVGSLHPLVSLSTRRSPTTGASCAIEASDDRARLLLEWLAARCGLHAIRPRGDRALYHAAACLVGNYPQALMEAAVQLFVASGIDPVEARRALTPLLASASRNAATMPGFSGLSGPVARGDVGVVERHLAVLQADPALTSIEQLYRAGALFAARMSAETHPEASEAIAALTKDEA